MDRTSKRCPRSNAEQFLCSEGQNRPFLGSWLLECSDPGTVRSVLMGCSDFYPCNAKLFQWKLRNSAECELCHGPCETSCHIQCVCPSLEHSRTQAHHSVWGMTFSKIQKHLKKECTAVKEDSVSSWHLIDAPEKYQHTAKSWKNSLMKFKEGSGSDDTWDHQAAITFLTDLDHKLANASTDSQEWEELVSAANDRAQELHVQLDDAISACKDVLNDSSFTFLRKYPITHAIHKELELQRLMGSVISKKRPDGLVVNWKKRRFFVLEFTRAYDMNSENLERTKIFKIQKYAKMCERIERALGPPWVGEVIAFTAGVRGSLEVKTWEQNLKAIGVQKTGVEKVINSATKSLLEQCHFMYQAREAALRLIRRTPEDPQNTSG